MPESRLQKTREAYRMTFDTYLCPSCEQYMLIRDTWEDCWLCWGCHTIVYPQDLGVPDNPDAGIRHIGKGSDGVMKDDHAKIP